MLHSVRTKLLTLLVAVVVATVAATTIIHTYLFRTHQVWYLQASALAVGTAVRSLLEQLHAQKPGVLLASLGDMNRYCHAIAMANYPTLAAIAVIDANGKTLFGNIPSEIRNTPLVNALFQDRTVLANLLAEDKPRFMDVAPGARGDLSPSMTAVIPIHGTGGEPTGAVVVALWADAVEHDLRTLVLTSLLAGLCVTLLAAALGRWGVDWVVMNPLQRLLQAIREVSVQGAGTGGRIAIGKADELETLGQAFNDMLERLESSRSALARNEQFLEVIVENIPILLGVQEATDLRFVRFNRAGESMFGLRREELLGRTPHEVFPTEAATRYVARDQAILAAGVPVDVPEERVQSKILGERIFYTRKIPLFDEQRRPVYLLGISEDITERRHMEDVRRFGAFQAGIAEMSVSVLHNIGNAVTAVTDDAEQILRSAKELARVAELLAADIERTEITVSLMDKTTQGEQCIAVLRRLLTVQRGIVQAIQENGLQERSERIERSVRHIADIVRIQQSAVLPGGGASALSLQRVLEDALVMQGESLSRHDVTVTMQLDTSVDEITTYRNRLLQALINLIKNSYEAIRERQMEEHIAGHIVITTRPAVGGQVVLSIADNGIGIEQERLQNIFRFGYSTKVRGTGFGLHSVANFVQEQGGRIEAHSAGRHQGAEFVIQLPLRMIRESPIPA